MAKQKLSLLGSAGVGAGLGAGLMYLLDPQGGGQRRAVARDKTVSALKTGGSACLKTGKHLGNRTKGLVAEAGSKLRRETVDEQVLGDRVRSKLGRVLSNPSAVEVTSVDGLVILSGSVPSSEKDRLLSTVAKVKGVKDVEDQLEVHEHGGETFFLEGDGKSRSRLARAWKPATLILAGTGGAALALAGFKRRDKVGTALGAAGLGILANSFTKRSGRDEDLLSEGDGSVGLSSSQPTTHSGGLDNLDNLEDPGLQSELSEDRELQTTLP
jgi:hypothetical protein